MASNEKLSNFKIFWPIGLKDFSGTKLARKAYLLYSETIAKGTGLAQTAAKRKAA